MRQTARFQEILRRLAIIDEGFAEDQAGLGLGLPASRLLDPKTAALVRVGALVAIGSPGVCLEWGTTRALAAGATEDEITGVLLAIAPVAGLVRGLPDRQEQEAAEGGDLPINGANRPQPSPEKVRPAGGLVRRARGAVSDHLGLPARPRRHTRARPPRRGRRR